MALINLDTTEDVVVFGKLLVALGEHIPQDLVAWDYGPHRLYQVSILTREDEPFIVEQFCNSLDNLNTVGPIKPQFYSIESYPAFQNVQRSYITVYI